VHPDVRKAIPYRSGSGPARVAPCALTTLPAVSGPLLAADAACTGALITSPAMAPRHRHPRSSNPNLIRQVRLRAGVIDLDQDRPEGVTDSVGSGYLRGTRCHQESCWVSSLSSNGQTNIKRSIGINAVHNL
jgi:hypothetical protein